MNFCTFYATTRLDRWNKEIIKVAKLLNQHFEAKDLGDYLGINVQRDKDSSFLLKQKSKIEAAINVWYDV